MLCESFPMNTFDLNGTLRSTGSPPMMLSRCNSSVAVNSRDEDDLGWFPVSLHLKRDIRITQAALEFCLKQNCDFRPKYILMWPILEHTILL